MACERYREVVADAAAGMAIPAELAAHLATCEACRSELQGLQRALGAADAVLVELGSAEPDAALRARIRRAVAEEQERGSAAAPGWRTRWTAAAALATATALVVAGLVLRERGSSPAEPRLAASHPVEATPPATPADGSSPEGRGIVAEAVPSSAAPPSLEPAPGSRPGSRRAAPPAMHPASHHEAAEVLVPPGQTEVLLRFAELIQRERPAPPSLIASGQPSPELAGPAALEIEPLEIVPLDPAESTGT